MILNNIKSLCATEKIAIAALERKLDIANGTIGKWDVCSPNVATLKKVADFFGVTVDELLREE